LAYTTSYLAGYEFAQSGGIPEYPAFVLSGWIGAVQMLKDGRRQIIDLHIPGDLTCYRIHRGARSSLSYVCLTPVIFADATRVIKCAKEEPGTYPGLASALTLIEEEAHNRLVEQIVRNGRLLAPERIAHLAIEFLSRFHRIELADIASFPMPLSQEALGDLLGMSTVHVNRTLQQLRRDQLLKTDSHRWHILDKDRLTEIATGEHYRHTANPV
jgi:CRP-like cAMP-binding protein